MEEAVETEMEATRATEMDTTREPVYQTPSGYQTATTVVVILMQVFNI